ncbi:glycoside hydrolase family 9 protein [Vararia minispora EC-137]|uniref:Glycoside hydrolase family 9 protein n=1 Tax=Vararia minispora EC-137 TaxID=1314806 RepID=A0ACB8QPM9_9AGAM|nr:glycoside hydrolase family 9 protein [Vararia minispora EC-137]
MLSRPALPLSLFALATQVLAQLPLPNPPWQPPTASNGAVVSAAQTSTPNPQWSTMLGDLLYFYEAQRSGRLPSTKRPAWRNDSAVSDGQDVNLDLTGGYYDAGDYIKCTYPLSFTIMSICWGANDFGRGYDMANQTAYLDDMLRWGLDWMIKAHPESNTLYVQVANANLDNAYWGGDENIPYPRPSYPINATKRVNFIPGTDAAASAAAAFAACSNLYAGRSFGSAYTAPASLQNSSYATTLLTHAQQLYAFATNSSIKQQTYQTAVPEAGTAYASSSYGDDLTIAALHLAQATNSTDMYQQGVNFYRQFSLTGSNQVFNWDSKTPGVYVLLSQLAQANSLFASNQSGWQAEAERYFDNIVNRQSKTSNGLLWYDGDSNDASLNPALNAAMLLRRYAPLASSQSRQTSYLNLAQQQMDYALGNNPMHAPYVVGVNPNSPSNPHSAMASGGSDINNIDTVPAQEAYVLYGAVIGGPSRRDLFHDMRSDWVESEVALDYNAPMLTLAAARVMSDAADPFYTRLQAGAYASVKPSSAPCDNAVSTGCRRPGLSTGARIAIGIVVGLVGLLILCMATYCLRRGRRR